MTRLSRRGQFLTKIKKRAWNPIANFNVHDLPRLDIIHHIYLMLLDGKLLLAPIQPGIQNILDIGTGTGIWAIDAAE
jgi:ubiquinone/menaquinone biosynthesis C-methylase UbiE